MRTPPSERNLLFAVLALQNELAKPDDVLSAMQAWVAAKHRSLGELLVERGALDPEHRRLLDALIEAQLARHGNAEQSLAALDPSSRARRLLEKVADPDVQASLAALPAAADVDKTISFRPTEAGPRYRVLRPHAEGGLGEVFVAEDVELHREVALKEIKKEYAREEVSRGRFVQEAEITGGLEHPGIVPVYGLGTYADGRPFYAMRFIKGDNLKAAIERFHGCESVRFDSLEFRQLLGRFVDVCQAVAYAHSRGILHRDLKPGNIMLGKFGETLVVDWGLAKVVGRAGEDHVSGRDEATLRPSSGSGWAETALGSAIGTPGFMSPEQAVGKLDELGPATDVYSLGATLYMLLTNRPPCDGSVAEILEQVRRGSWTPPRAVNATVPAALNAICCKAMALEPEDRYGTPLELAGDVEHWLADEPVTAYREPVLARTRRWMRQHPSRVTAGGVTLLALVVGLAIGAGLLQWSKTQIETEKARADENFKLAKEAVDKYFRQVSEVELLKEPRLASLRKTLLGYGFEFYEKFVKQQGNALDLRRDLAEYYARAGGVYRNVYTDPGQRKGSKEGMELLARAVEEYEQLVRGMSGDRELRRQLATCSETLAWEEWWDGDPNSAMVNIDRTIELMEQLRTEDRTNADDGRLLGSAYSVRAMLRRNIGGYEEHAADDIRKSVEVIEATRRLEPNNLDVLGELAQAYHRSYRLDTSLRAVELYRKVVTKNGKDARHPGSLANGLRNLGFQYINHGQPSHAEPFLREAVEMSRDLDRQFPEEDNITPKYTQQQRGRFGESLLLQGHHRAARGPLKDALGVMDELQKRQLPLSGSFLEFDGWFSFLLGLMEAEAGNVGQGLTYCESGLEHMTLAREHGLQSDPQIDSDSLWIEEAIARYRFQAGRMNRDQLVDEQRRTLSARKSLFARAPKAGNFAGEYQLEIGTSAAVLAGYLLEADRAKEALEVVQDVLPAQEQLVTMDHPEDHNFPQVDFRNYSFRSALAELLARQGDALARTGQPVDASKSVHRAIDFCEEIAKPEPCYLYDLAHHLTFASTLPGEDAQALADRAVKALADFIASGFDNPYKLRNDPRLEPLRNREDFQKLVQDLEATVKETQEP